MDLVGDSSVLSVVSVVSLNSNDAVTDGHVLHHRFLKEGRVKARSIVVDVTNVNQQLGRVGPTWIPTIFFFSKRRTEKPV